MSPEKRNGLAGRVNLEGTNIGASTSINHRTTGEAESCCSVNIYINSNVQGVNNSMLLGSRVMLNDPGVHLYLGDLYIKGGCFKTKSKSKKKKDSWFYGLLLVVTSFLVLVSFILSL